MSYILYYSNFCEHSKELLGYITKNNFNGFKFLCIDRRYTGDGQTYIITEKQDHLLLPKMITNVPALLLLDENNNVIFGKEIYRLLKKKQVSLVKDATNNDEPNSFVIRSSFGNSIASDTFSFLDMEADDLSAKGEGGVRQMHSYAGIDFEDKIYTPEENYSSNKMDEEISVSKLQEARERDLPKVTMKI
mgnify:FL=1